MGFFSLSAKCGVCGNDCGLNRFQLKKSNSWLCSACMKRAGGMMGTIQDKPIVNCTVEEIQAFIEEKDNFSKKEFRKKCNVCGKVFCYTNEDLKKNLNLASQAKGAARAALFESLGGTTIAASLESNRSQSLSAQVKDFTRCPDCNSSDLTELTEEEYKDAIAAKNAPTTSMPSAADELKKFKELLDMGVISQEEFDAKKKQLLGL